MTIDTKELRQALGAVSPEEVEELLDRLEAAEKSDAESIAMYRKARDERDALRAKIEQMEKQEPAAWYYTTNDTWDCYSREKPPEDATDVDSLRPLYLAPGAQPTPTIPEGWKLVPIEPTPEMRDAWDSSPICEDDNAEFRRAYSEMLAAAPEAKP